MVFFYPAGGLDDLSKSASDNNSQPTRYFKQVLIPTDVVKAEILGRNN